MLASRAVFIDIDIATRSARIEKDPGPGPHPLVRALGPALDTAYGLEPVCLLPEPIRGLADRLLAGPLGTEKPFGEIIAPTIVLEAA